MVVCLDMSVLLVREGVFEEWENGKTMGCRSHRGLIRGGSVRLWRLVSCYSLYDLGSWSLTYMM